LFISTGESFRQPAPNTMNDKDETMSDEALTTLTHLVVTSVIRGLQEDGFLQRGEGHYIQWKPLTKYHKMILSFFLIRSLY
jgi:hypothetical protein